LKTGIWSTVSLDHYAEWIVTDLITVIENPIFFYLPSLMKYGFGRVGILQRNNKNFYNMLEKYLDSPLSQDCDSVLNKLWHKITNRQQLLLGIFSFFVAGFDTSWM